MINHKSYNGKCWICGEIADSGEHIYKRTDLVREFNGIFSAKEHISIKGRGEKDIIIQGPNSKNMKFPDSLCKKCNNERTQPFDLTYDVFCEFYKKKESEIFNSKVIDLEKMFGESWEVEFRKLQKYYVKHIGCVLYYCNLEIFEDLVSFILHDTELVSLKFNYVLRTDIFDLCSFIEKEDNEEFSYLGRGKLEGEYSVSGNSWYNLTSSYIYRSLELSCYYSDENEINSNFLNAPIIPLIVFENPSYEIEIDKIKNSRKNIE